MSVPQLTRQLILETRVRTPDGAGGYAESWQALGTLWAEVVPRSGRQAAQGAVSVSRGSFRITLRAAPMGSPSRPRPGQRFRAGDRIFAITAVTERDAEARYLTCHCDEEISL
ncbi:phage head closure protein [Roseovarius nubinhibens]|uniref:Phage tail protein n=1 Tax=Roseovarius nubinhibens TaxID=314263 RepID=A0A348WAR2_9RHOB|nr:phage tail protein [Roseovarius nubinhibens]